MRKGGVEQRFIPKRFVGVGGVPRIFLNLPCGSLSRMGPSAAFIAPEGSLFNFSL